VPNEQQGYPGGIFDPLGFSKGNLKELQTKEVKNGRLAMVAFMGFVLQVGWQGGGGFERGGLGERAGSLWTLWVAGIG
jgi:light-harvesting complex I chlorophyll a/b binding protein 4